MQSGKQQQLGPLRMKLVVDPKLVRGLDYYSHTIFEFVTLQSDKLGAAQGTVLAGGRYDGLVETMGGPPTPGVGWACGIERLCLLLPEERVPEVEREGRHRLPS